MASPLIPLAVRTEGWAPNAVVSFHENLGDQPFQSSGRANRLEQAQADQWGRLEVMVRGRPGEALKARGLGHDHRPREVTCWGKDLTRPRAR